MLTKIKGLFVALIAAVASSIPQIASATPTVYTFDPPEGWDPQGLFDGAVGDNLPWILAAIAAVAILVLGVAFVKGMLGKASRMVR